MSGAAVSVQAPSESFWESIAHFLFPAYCQICERARSNASAGFVCEDCDEKIARIQPPFCDRCGLPSEGEITNTFTCANCRTLALDMEWARAAVIADGNFLNLIHRYKYQGALWFEACLARVIRQSVKSIPDLHAWRWIVPVPLHRVKLREREFNQAERLAHHLSLATGIPVNPGLIWRRKPTPSQTRLSREQRAENMRDAFQPVCGAMLHGDDCLVFDDILTTGATTNAVCRALRSMGAGRVAVWTLARGT
jgi:ComF family protein